jgi:hypothetical protein
LVLSQHDLPETSFAEHTQDLVLPESALTIEILAT